MTPRQFAKAECANLLPDGRCLGIRSNDLLDHGQVKLARPRDRCLLTERGKRCRYFEQIVLPLADQPPPKDDPGLQARRLQAREAYYWQLPPSAGYRSSRPDRPGRASKERRCPDCGNMLGRRQRYCPACQAKHRRAKYRRRRDKQRRSAPPLTSKLRL